MTWQPIETAPKTGESIILRAGKWRFEAQWTHLDGDTCGWAASYEGEHPPCWCDGFCWGSNSNEQPSLRPTHWKPLPVA